MKKRKTISIIILILLLGFIWGHSMMSREASQEESLMVGGFIAPFLELFVGRGNVTDHLVRKLAHFTEYAALGMALGDVMRVYGRKGLWNLSHFFLFGMATAVIDEGIQLISDGRGAQVSDILLDCCGVAAGLAVIMIVFKMEERHERKL